MSSVNQISDKKYAQYNDYYFKSVLLERANGLLKFIGIPYEIVSIMLSEFTNVGPGISRIDFAGDVKKDDTNISLILECQSKLPTEEDIKRFFQYVASLRNFKNQNVELFILCTEKVPYDKKEFVINDECTYMMHVISLKDFKASTIFKNIENKLNNNEKITEEDIASLQLIVYTDYDELEYEVLIEARWLLEEISKQSNMDINEKNAIIYLFDVLSTNMLDDVEMEKYGEVTYMLLNPMDRFLEDKGRKDGKLDDAKILLKKGFSIEEIVEITKLSQEDIRNLE